TRADVQALEPAKYTHGHDNLDDEYKKEIEDKLKQRKQYDDELSNMTMDKFDTDPKMGGYGFSHEVGADIEFIEKEKDDNVLETYKKLKNRRDEELRRLK